MTDPMELVRRLEAKADSVGFGEWITRDVLKEAAACIRDMVERIDQLETQIDNLYFELTEF